MKAITIKQPWAWLIVEGIKDVENRTWPTKFRGRVLIHAAAKGWKFNAVINYLSNAARYVMYKLGYDEKWLKELPTGAIIGLVEIVDCVINHQSIWAEKSFSQDTCNCVNYGTKDCLKICAESACGKFIYNWVLANPIKFPEPIPCKGKLSFWDYTEIISDFAV